MIAGLLLMLAANAAALLGARLILERVRTGQGSVDALLFLTIRLILISVAVLTAGITHTLTRWGLGLAGVAALLGFVAAGARRKFPRPAWPVADAWMAAAAAIVAARFAAQAWFFSPHLGDAVAYHLPKVAEWIRSGGFTREMGLHSHVTFPAGFELIEAWWVVFLRHDVLIEAAGAEFLLLAFAAVRALGRTVGLDARQAALAGLFYVLTPGLHLSASSCLNDAAAAGVVVATAALIAARAPAALVLMTAAWGLGIKATAAYAFPGLLLLMILLRKEPASTPPSRGWAALLAAAGLVAGLFWYARNFVWFGNPVYPVGEPGYGQDPVAVQVGPRWSAGLANALALLGYRIYDRQTALGANVDDMAGWGPAAFACGIVAMIPAAIQNAAFRRLALAFVVSLGSCLLLIIHDPWCLKYVFFFPAVAALAIVPLMSVHPPIRVIAGGALAFAFLATFLPYDLPAGHFRGLWRQGWRERTALEEPEAVRREDIVACAGRMGRAYLLYRPDFSRRVVYVREESADELAEAAGRAGARIAYFKPQGVAEHEMLDDGVRRGRLEALGGHFYRLQPSNR